LWAAAAGTSKRCFQGGSLGVRREKRDGCGKASKICSQDGPSEDSFGDRDDEELVKLRGKNASAFFLLGGIRRLVLSNGGGEGDEEERRH